MATWLDSLRGYVESHPAQKPTTEEGAVDTEVCRILEDRRARSLARSSSSGGGRRSKSGAGGAGAGAGAGAGDGHVAHPSEHVIPRFFFKQAANPLSSTFEVAAQQRALRKKINELPSEEELAGLQVALREAAGADSRINYDAFCTVRDSMPEKMHVYFKPSVFVKLSPDSKDCIHTNTFYAYVRSKVILLQTRIQLALQDPTCTGSLKETDLENFVYNLIPELPPLRGLQESFYPFYVFHAVRKFMFFVPSKNGSISIKNIISSKVLAELLELKSDGWTEADNRRNWFSGAKALSVYSTYLELDTDHNGMLSKSELSYFGRGTLTKVVVDRLFEEFNTYSGEMDYKTFLDFILAMEYKKSQQSVAYFFRVLDIHHKGYLTRFNINFFFREILARMPQQEPIAVADVCDEIFDMIKPAHPAHIKLKDLIRAGVGHTVAHMLTDVNGFWTYDNRESLMHEDDDPGDDM